MPLELIDPLTDPRWMHLLERAPGACIFHHPGWLALLRDQYGYDMSAWCLGDRQRLTSGLPVARVTSPLTGKRLVALPFSDSCPPLNDPAEASDGLAFAQAVAAQQRRLGLDLEVRGQLPGDAGAHEVVRFLGHRLRLSSRVEDVEARFSKSQIRRNIAKARREGVTVERHADPQALGRFYRLHQRTRRRQGVPTQPKAFIMGFARLFDAGLGFVLTARHEGRDIAAAVFMTCAGTLTYKYGATDRRFQSTRPNNLLFSEAIRWGCQNGQHTLDFGRTERDNSGLRAFKSAWGTEECELPYSFFTDDPPKDVSGWGERALGTLIRHAPPTFGRMVGETLYRHFG